MEYILKKNNNPKNEKAYGKYYAKPKPSETKDIDYLAEYLHNSNTPFSAGAIKGILTDLVKSIKQILLLGYNVKLDNLAIFSLGIKNKEGSLTEEDFSTVKNIAGVRLRTRATGQLNYTNLNLGANLTKATAVPAKKKKANSTDGDGGGSTPSGGGSGNQGGSGSSGTGSETGDGDLNL